jgi:hypothetical protein
VAAGMVSYVWGTQQRPMGYAVGCGYHNWIYHWGVASKFQGDGMIWKHVIYNYTVVLYFYTYYSYSYTIYLP